MIKHHKTKLCQLEESNLRPSLYEGDALPAELCRHKRKDVNQTSQHLSNSGSQTRTDDNLINSQVLYQLSYAGIMRGNVLSSQGAIPQLLSAC